MPDLVAQPGQPPRTRPSAVGQHRRQQPHRVGAVAVAHRLDVGVRRRVERRGDRDAAGEVDVARAARRRTRPATRSWSGSAARAAATGAAAGRCRASGAAAAGCRRCRPRGRRASAVTVGGCGGRTTRRCATVSTAPAAGRRSRSAGHRGQRADLAPAALGQPQVVLHQRVLRAVPAAGHALAALDAAGAARARPRRSTGPVDRRPPGCSPKNTPTGVSVKVWPTPISSATCLHRVVGRGRRRVLASRRASGSPGRSTGASSARQSVMSRHCGSSKNASSRLVERVGVDERAAADAGAGEHRDVRAAGGSAGCRSSPAAAPRGTAAGPTTSPANSSSANRRPASSTRDPVALLGQPQRGDRAAEAGPDDDDVVVVLPGGRPVTAGRGP